MSLRCPECRGTGRIKDPRVQCKAVVPASDYREAGRCRKRAVYASLCSHHQPRRKP